MALRVANLSDPAQVDWRHRGSAAAQCGKALPYRAGTSLIFERLRLEPKRTKAQPKEAKTTAR